MLIKDKEKELAGECVGFATKAGATGVRIALDKSVMDSYALRDGELDKVMHTADCSVTMTIFVDGSCGCFSTNKIERQSLQSFIKDAVARTSLLGKDPFRRLADPSRQCRTALSGLEMGLYDATYDETDNDKKRETAFQEYRNGQDAISGAMESPDFLLSGTSSKTKAISCETEYSDSIDDSYLIDSQGFEGRHIETGFSCYAQSTVVDGNGNRFSGSWWESCPERAGLEIGKSTKQAYMRACSQTGAKKHRNGRSIMVVDSSTASTFVSPIINALYGSSIQQDMSFLKGRYGERVFPEHLSIIDMALEKGKAGARLYDGEGVATGNLPLVENGVVANYLISTYMSGKLGMAGTIEDVSRPSLLQFGENMLSLEDILHGCGKGILVTGINGGNCNPVTGDFSYGIEGFSFRDGRIVAPVREMLVTGNVIDLWSRLIAVGGDARKSLRWQIPSVAFDGVSFSA